MAIVVDNLKVRITKRPREKVFDGSDSTGPVSVPWEDFRAKWRPRNGAVNVQKVPSQEDTQMGSSIVISDAIYSGNNSKEDFEAKYFELSPLGKGGFGTVYAGFRWPEYTPVAIKHMVKAQVSWTEVVRNGKVFMIPKEAALMLQASGPAETTGNCIAVSLMDWFTLDQEVILVMERPTPVMDLQAYLRWNDYYLSENVAKVIVKQLIDGAIDMNSKGVFHRDIKLENLLIEQLSSGLRVRVIDFGCGSTVTKSYYTYAGTSAFAPPEWFLSGRYKAGPTTVWQIGALLFDLVCEDQNFDTRKFLRDCQDFLHRCLLHRPRRRATLEELQNHPWLHKI